MPSLIALLAAVWVFIDGSAVGAISLRVVGCRYFGFHAQSVRALYENGSWMFGVSNESQPAEPAVQIVLFGSCENGVWANTSRVESASILELDDVISRHPADFLSSLETWVMSRPTGDLGPRVLQSIKFIRSNGTPWVPSVGYQQSVTTTLWGGVAHDALTGCIALIGLASAVLWADRYRLRIRDRLRRTNQQCPKCSYDINGLRDARCPECGAQLDSPS